MDCELVLLSDEVPVGVRELEREGLGERVVEIVTEYDLLFDRVKVAVPVEDDDKGALETVALWEGDTLEVHEELCDEDGLELES